MKETINSWMLKNNEQTKFNLRYRGKKGVLKHNGTRFHVFMCNNCNRVYEQNPFLNEGAKIYFYKDFPTYKLERKECVYCCRQKNLQK